MQTTTFERTLAVAVRESLRHLDAVDTASVAATASLGDLRERFGGPLPEHGTAPEAVVTELVNAVEGGILGSAGGRFFGWVIGGALPSALAADWLSSAWDQNTTLYATGPAASVAEEAAGLWLKSLLRLPADASFALTTGCQMAHVTCLAAARNALLAKRGWDDQDGGLAGAPPIRVLTSDERHGSIERAVRLLGIGRRHLVELPADAEGRLSPAALRDALDLEPATATIVVLNAGDLNIAAFDPFAALVPLAHSRGAWVHIDGAFGLWAAASPARRHLVAGAELADSWATDGHKWLNVPFDCGYAFVRDAAAHRAAMTHRASYLVHEDGARDAIDWTPDWSRRSRGFSTWAALRELGRAGVADLVDRCCQHARTLVEGMGALPNAEVLWVSALNQGLVRFHRSRAGATLADDDEFTDRVIHRINASGTAFFTPTTWRGRRAMRVSVCNWRTTPADIALTISAVHRALLDSHRAEGAGLVETSREVDRPHYPMYSNVRRQE
jgi:glutamate/tyrosine decarboxylase-like PLP-dependent enzyme